MCNVKMMILDLERIALPSEVRMVYSFFKLNKMHKMALLKCAIVLRELKM